MGLSLLIYLTINSTQILPLCICRVYGSSIGTLPIPKVFAGNGLLFSTFRLHRRLSRGAIAMLRSVGYELSSTRNEAHSPISHAQTILPNIIPISLTSGNMK